MLRAGRWQIRFPTESFGFFIDIIPPVLSCLGAVSFSTCCILRCLVCIVVSCLVRTVVVVLSVLLSSYVYLLCYVCIAVSTLDVGLLARSQYSEGPATGHIDTGFSWFPFVYKQMLRWFQRFQVALHASHVALPT